MKQQSGTTLVEVLVAIGLLGIMLPALMFAFITANHAGPAADKKLHAAALLRESREAVRSVRDDNWANISSNGTYHTVTTDGHWALAGNSATTNGFTRKIVITSVHRDANGNIVKSGGAADSSTKQISLTISWKKPVASKLSETIYLTKWEQ
jgi:type II secretory pathway pseudopilin PulG